MPLSNSLMPNATDERFQQNTYLATRGLPFNIVSTSPIAWRRTGHGIKSLFVNNFNIRRQSIMLLSKVIHYNVKGYAKDQVIGGIRFILECC
jgi:hypothetical protein